MRKVLVTDAAHPLLLQGLEKAGFQCEDRPEISLEEVRQIVGNYVGLVINSKIKVDRELLDAAGQLRFIARLGSGLEIIDLEYAREKGVAIYNSPEGNRNAVAEHALGMLLVLSNQLLAADREVRQKVWRREARRGWELWGKTLGIIGFGHTGSSFAAKLAGLGLRLLAYDKYHPFFADQFSGVESVGLEKLLRESDIISLHLPLTPEVRHLVDRDFLSRCRDGVVLINTSRGQVIRTEDLVEGLDSGKVGGACLDVFENEKPATFSEEEDRLYRVLYEKKNVVLSPHVAGWTKESKKRIASVLLQKITRDIT